jgi:SAM-dependent methyltransferase
MDLVVCNHVYEHVPDPRALLGEIARVLRPGGACYFASGHRLQLIEPHYRLPFLSWLPRPVADAYVRGTGRGTGYEETFLPPWRLRGLFGPFAEARDVTGDVLRECHRFGLGPRTLEKALSVLPAALASGLGKLLPTYIWILRK